MGDAKIIATEKTSHYEENNNEYMFFLKQIQEETVIQGAAYL